jgi:hypothetical protein
MSCSGKNSPLSSGSFGLALSTEVSSDVSTSISDATFFTVSPSGVRGRTERRAAFWGESGSTSSIRCEIFQVGIGATHRHRRHSQRPSSMLVVPSAAACEG